AAPPRPAVGTPQERAILAALASGPLHIEDIIKQTNLHAPEAAQSLALLEITNKIRNLGANVYSLN
ncbi:MAG: DNA-processing protein DprA, partial [Candidatus Saccharimonadales bacterium]